MNLRCTATVLALGGLVVTAAPPAAAQQANAAGGGWEVPRTPHGHPDLQGNWTTATITPLERPEGQGPVLDWNEVARLEGAAEARVAATVAPTDPNRPPPPAGSSVGGYDGFYIDRGERVAIVNGEPRSSLITFPENGRVPRLSREGEQSRAANLAFRAQFGEYDHPELRPLGERCIVSFGTSAGPPMLPNNFYNNNYSIVQTADHVMIMAEMVHDARIIRIGEGPRLPEHVRPWFGDSWGWWEGDTLVVETTNINPLQRYRGNASDNLKVIERFHRADAETVLYRFTILDPTTYSEPWGGEVPMMAFPEQLYEYSCHEGNYALDGILSGARFEERRAAEGGAAESPQ
jgi:hypothetical protein